MRNWLSSVLRRTHNRNRNHARKRWRVCGVCVACVWRVCGVCGVCGVSCVVWRVCWVKNVRRCEKPLCVLFHQLSLVVVGSRSASNAHCCFLSSSSFLLQNGQHDRGHRRRTQTQARNGPKETRPFGNQKRIGGAG
jgi:hypothetical protein